MGNPPFFFLFLFLFIVGSRENMMRKNLFIVEVILGHLVTLEVQKFCKDDAKFEPIAEI
jgi:hypothetical protein